MKHKKGFTLVELLVVIAIIGLLSTIAFISLNSARAKARDAKRVSDIRQVQSALELFYNDQTSPAYPLKATASNLDSSVLSSTYVASIPTAPQPNDGTCTAAQNTYRYLSVANSGTYSMTFCLGSASGGLPAGCVVAGPAGMVTGACI